jgi:purine-binding chemotaxis protein CheW
MSTSPDSLASLPKTAALGRVGRYTAFLVAGRRFAVPAAEVAEVLRGGRMTSVPRAPDFFAGLLNLRGRIVPVIDLERRLGLQPPVARSRERIHLVLQPSEEWCSLLVDEILDVIEIADDDFHPVAAQQASDATDAAVAVHAAEDALLYLLDLRQLLKPAAARTRTGAPAAISLSGSPSSS